MSDSTSVTPGTPLDPVRAFQGVLDFLDAAGRWEPLSEEDLAPLFPKLRIEKRIGRGGMGAVYKATRIRGGEPVAIKVLPIEMAADKEFEGHFFDEAVTLAKLHHPGIVEVHSFGRTDAGHLYFIMEYVDGPDLHRLIHCCGLEPRRALAIMSQICDALDCAHRITTHGDLKPGNVLVGAGGRAKLADFGLARPIRAEASSLARSYFTLANSPYLAPERRTGDGDKRSDLFSVGVMFYEMLTGHAPGEDFVPASRKVPVDARVDAIILRALQPDPARRYQSAGDMKRDVDRVSRTRFPPGLRFALPLLVIGALVAGVVFALKSEAPNVAARLPASTPSPAVVPDESDFTPLLDAAHLGDWKQCGPGGLRIADGIATTWTPSGERWKFGHHWYAARTFRDFILKAEFKVESLESNAGIFIRFPDPGDDPKSVHDQGCEIEIHGTGTGRGTTGALFYFNPPRVAALKIDDWNAYEIKAVANRFEVKLNGIVVNDLVNERFGGRHLEGYIGLQNHLEGPVHFRNLRIKELPSTPVPEISTNPPRIEGTRIDSIEP